MDWRRSLRATRAEETSVTEQLQNLLVHARSLDEIARAVAEEHQSGRTSTASATGVTAGGAVAAGALIGAIGGAVVGGTTGLAVDIAVGGTDLGAGTITGTILGSIAGSAVGAGAGGAAASLIMSGAGALGFIESDTRGDRDIVSQLQQNILDSTLQKASAIRSLRSNIFLESTQAEQENLTTVNVTNYNHSHALTIQYFEVLQKYNSNLEVAAVEPLLFLPFKPIDFDKDTIVLFWDVLRLAVRNQALRDAADQLVGVNGLIELPDEPVSQVSGAVLQRLKVKVRVKLGLSIASMKVFLVEATERRLSFQRDLGLIDGGSFGFLDDFQEFEFENNFPADNQPDQGDIRAIKVVLEGGASRDINVIVQLAEVTDGTRTASVRDRNLGTKTFAGIGTIEKSFDFDLQNVLATIEQNQTNADAIGDKLLRYIRGRRYLFTRVLLSNMETEQVADLLDNLVLINDGATIPLRAIVETVPLGFTSRFIVLRMRLSINKTLRDRLPDLADFPAELATWFTRERPGLRRMTPLALPTSGVFTEAVLGRANASEKIDLTRFFNWQDSPIPNPAPVISPVQAGGAASRRRI